MPVKDLKGGPRQTPAQRELRKEMLAFVEATRRRLDRDGPDAEPFPAPAPSGPPPAPLTGAAALDLD